VPGWLCIVSAIAVSGSSHAQVLPQTNPGAIESEIRRQQERMERGVQPPRLQGPAVVGPSPRQSPLLQPGGPKFRLKSIRFDDSKFLTTQELDAIVAPYIGKNVDFSDLQKIIAAVNALYQQRGIITGIATLPPQTVDGGVVRIQLTEGRLGRVSFDGRVQTSEDYILQRVGLPKPGEVVDVPQVTRDVVWFNRTNDVQIRTLLQPGTTFGLTDIQLAVVEPRINTLQFFADNQGVQTTGRYQVGAFYRRHGTLGVDDRFTFYGTKSLGNLNGNVSYTVPFNPLGGRVGVSYTRGAIEIIKGPFAGLNVTGESEQAAVNVTQPLYAGQSWLVLANGAYTRSRSLTDFDDTTTTDDRARKFTAGYGVTSFGDIHTLTISPAYNRIESRSHVSGLLREFETYTGMLSGFLRLPADFSVSILGSWQITPNEKLLPGDQLFSIGGPTTVRGYPTSFISGDSGYYLNLEAHRDLSSYGLTGLDVYLFHDVGSVYSVNPPSQKLASVGAGLSWTYLAAMTVEASVGQAMLRLIPTQRMTQLYTRVVFRPLLIPGLVEAMGIRP
jgi:hemolysin activation/secretion protein